MDFKNCDGVGSDPFLCNLSYVVTKWNVDFGREFNF